MCSKNNFARRSVSTLFAVLILSVLLSGSVFAQTTAFTYQGRFTDSSPNPPSSYTMTFNLYDTDGVQSPGTLIGTQQAMVSVVNGIFTVKLDFGTTAFNTTSARYLEIQVGGTTLTPRQEITSTPFAQRSLNAANADKLGGVAANQFVQTSDARLTDARTPTSGSSNYIQNTTTQQTANFSISGGGTAGNLNVRSGGTGLTLNDNILRLRTSNDNNHGMLYNSAIDGVEFRANNGYRWMNGTNGATQRMALDASGNLTVGGTITGTLANNSVGTAQVADGSLRLTDISIAVTSVSFPQLALGAHSCASLNGNFSATGAAVGDVVTLYPPGSNPAGFYIQPTTITDVTAVTFSICNTLSTTNTFPAQSVRTVVMRP